MKMANTRMCLIIFGRTNMSIRQINQKKKKKKKAKWENHMTIVNISYRRTKINHTYAHKKNLT